MILGFLPLIVVGLIVWAIVSRREAGGDGEGDEGGLGSVKRLVLYGLGFVAIMFAAAGVGMLAGGALDAAFGDLVLQERRSDFAVALAFATVGIPAWLVLLLLAHRATREEPSERRSEARRWYVNLVRGVALVIVVVNASTVGRHLLGAEAFDAGAYGWLLVWAAVWLLHNRFAAIEPAETAPTRQVDRLYAYFATVLALGYLLVGVVGSIDIPLTEAYDRAFRETFLTPGWREQWSGAAVYAALGAVVWWWHWLRRLDEDDAGTTLWHVYVFLCGILVGVAMASGGAVAALHAALEWAIGEPTTSAIDHFAGIPDALAVVLVGLATWLYHRRVVAEFGGAATRSEPERVYRYVVAAAGLVAVAFAIATVLALLLDVVIAPATDVIRDTGWWRNDLVMAITLLVVGVPLWAYHWYRTAQAMARAGAAERESASRRVYVFGVLGIAVLAVLVTLVIVLYALYEAILESDPLLDTIRDVRWALAVFLSAGAIAVYHALVLREDQAQRASSAVTVESAAPARRRDVVLLAPVEAGELATALAAIPGVRLQRWQPLETADATAPTGEQIARVRDAIAAADADQMLVLDDGQGYRVVPYQVLP